MGGISTNVLAPLTLPTNIKIDITTELHDKTQDEWVKIYIDKEKKINKYYFELKTFQPSFDIKNFNELNKYNEILHDYKRNFITIVVNPLKNNKIRFNFTTNTRFYIRFIDGDHEYNFKNVIYGNGDDRNNKDDVRYITNSPLKDHSIVINRNKSKYNNNKIVTIYIDLYHFCLNHEFIITNFNDVIKKLK